MENNRRSKKIELEFEWKNIRQPEYYNLINVCVFTYVKYNQKLQNIVLLIRLERHSQKSNQSNLRCCPLNKCITDKNERDKENTI